MLHRTLATLSAVATAVSWVALVVPAQASPALPASLEGCLATPGGVFVVVDFQGSVTTGCAINPASGKAALQQVTSLNDPAGFVLQIGGKPDRPSSDPFIYWNYWHDNPSAGGWSGWTYSSEGTDTFVPKPGSIEGWAYGQTGTTPAWQPTGSPARTTAAPVTAPASSRPAALATSKTSEAATSSAPVTPMQASATPEATTASPSGPSSETTPPAPSGGSESPGPNGTLITIGLILMAGGATSMWLRRRRR